MPELPEVEIVRRGAHDWFVGRTIRSVEVLNPRATRRHVPGGADFIDRLRGTTIVATHRQGKYFWFELDSAELLVVHLGMSGQVRVGQPGDAPELAPPKHLRIRISFDDGRDDLLFIDQRTFGAMFLDTVADAPADEPSDSSRRSGLASRGSDVALPSQLAHIAPDPLSPQFDQATVVDQIRRRNSPIKAVILDQSVVSGIGNIYADEALWRTRLHWGRLASSLSLRKVNELLDHARDVMTQALAVGGTSFDSLYVNVNGSSGYFSRELAAYGREGKPCRRCGAPITRDHFANRSSFRCPRCQRPARIPRTRADPPKVQLNSP